MTEEKQFNPLPLPADLQLATVAEALTKPAARKPGRTRVAKPRRTRKANNPEVVRLTLAQIKGQLQSRLARLTTPRLKRLLRTCGLSFAVVASVALLAKYAPIVLVLIATLGIVGLASLYHRMSCISGFRW